MSGRPIEIEDPSNRWFIHRVSDAMMPVAQAWHVSPNSVSLLGLACGVAAGFFYAQAPAVIACLAGFACMIFWHVFDGLDGKLARATGQTSALGRVLDGLCDHGTFLAVYLGLGISIAAQGVSQWGLVALSAIAHAVQSNFYEARRQAYIARLSGKRALDINGPKTGFGGEALYDKVQYASLRWTNVTDDALAAAADKTAALAAYRHHAEPALKYWCLLGANVRTVMIFMFCLSPFGAIAYLLWEVFALTLLMIVLELQLRRAEHKFRQALPQL
jgi:CDP-diacylglycerol---serine O-phosphatidyltransferase